MGQVVNLSSYDSLNYFHTHFKGKSEVTNSQFFMLQIFVSETPAIAGMESQPSLFLNLIQFRLTLLLAVISFLTWVKWLLMFRMTKAFGPMFKIIEHMLNELVQFMIIVLLVLLMFTSVSMVAFGDDQNFTSFFKVLILYFEFTVGTWDFTVFQNVSIGYEVGRVFGIFFLLIMLVLFMNFLIAILSSVFAKYEN